ncbi:MAG: glycoside hydrolase family 43 protein [Chitinophagaceae bacterium]|nr:glycoside hydrolase family 43 protein [Chitinophagaceae bacterium]
MKKLIIFCLSLVVACFVQAQTDSGKVYLFSYFKNNGQDGLHLAYSNDGFRFKPLKNDSSFLAPLISNDKLMRDPCIIRGADGKFHMVWTVSWNDRGIGYASSPDLLNWSEQKYLPVMAHEERARNCWAPEVTYDPKKKEYMIYWATTITGLFPADTSVEKGYNHRIYYLTTKDFKKFSKTKLLYNQGFNVIDASIVPDGKRFIMFLKDETRLPPQKNLRVVVSDKLSEGYGNPSRPITGNYWAEGPTAAKVGDQWVVYFDKYRDHKYGAVSSPDLVNWTDVSEKIRMPAGARHGTIVMITPAELAVLLK